MTTDKPTEAVCWRSECRTGCYYPDACSEALAADREASARFDAALAQAKDTP